MYASLNDLLFPVFLFAIYFCGFSLLIYKPQKSSIASQESTEPILKPTLIDAEPDIPLAQPIIPEPESEATPGFDEEEISPPYKPIPEVEPDSLPDFENQNPLYIQTEAIINNLNKRQSRKICQPLGIKQKCGKAEKSLLSIRTEIENLFKHDPEKVISVIQEKLPELISLPVPTPAMTEMAAS